MDAVRDVLAGWPPALVLAVIGLSVTAESALTVGMVLPGTTALLILGFFSSAGVVPLTAALVVASIAALIGTNIAFFSGRRLGADTRTTRWGRWIGDARWQRADTVFARWGGRAVVVGQFVVVARTLVPRLAAMSGHPWRRFALGNFPAALVWANGFTAGGYLAGASYEQVSAGFGSAAAVLALSVLVAIVLIGVGRGVARHPEPITTAASAVHGWRPVRALLRGRDSWLTWLTRRSGTQAAIAVNFAVTIVVAAGLAVLAVFATQGIATGSRVALLDGPVADWMSARHDPTLFGASLAFTSVLQTPLVLLVAAVLSLFAVPRAWNRARDTASTRSLIAIGGLFVPLALLSWVTSALTKTEGQVVGLDELYFTQVAVVTCAATLTAWRLSRGRAWPVATSWWTAAALLTTVLIGARIYAGLSTVSAAAAAALLGLAWTLLLASSVPQDVVGPASARKATPGLLRLRR